MAGENFDLGDNWDLLGDPSQYGLGSPYDGSFDLNTSGAPTGGGYVSGNVNAGDDEQTLANSTYAGGGADPGSTPSISDLAKTLGKALGITSAADLGKLAAMIAPFAGALYSNSKTKTAANQLNNSLNTANTTLTDAYTKAGANLQPYAQAGTDAMSRAPGMMFKPTNYGALAQNFGSINGGGPLSPQFQPLGAGRGLTLGNIAKR